jgi:hypothetical protein
VGLPKRVLRLENRSIGRDGGHGRRGEPTLGQALEAALAEWRAGNRDRELGLHLLFLAWYCSLEPPHLTGFDAGAALFDLPSIFVEVYETFAPGNLDDVEFLYVVGLMAHLSPWLLGEKVETWESRSEQFRKRYRQLAPQGLPASRFRGRGAYGHYFASQVVVPGGF